MHFPEVLSQPSIDCAQEFPICPCNHHRQHLPAGNPQLNYALYEEPSGFAQFEPAGVIWYLFVLGLEEKESNQSLFTLFMLFVFL